MDLKYNHIRHTYFNRKNRPREVNCYFPYLKTTQNQDFLMPKLYVPFTIPHRLSRHLLSSKQVLDIYPQREYF